MEEAFLSKGEDGIPFIQLGEYVLRLELEPLDGAYKERAIKELRETPENYENGLVKLKELVKAQENLYLPVDDDDLLLKFLRPCKFYPDSAFKLMHKYYKFKAKNQKYCADLWPETVSQMYLDKILDFMPIREDGTRIMLVNTDRWNPKNYGVDLLFKGVIMAIEIAMIEPKTQVSGVHVLLDVYNLTLSQIMQFTPMVAKLIMDFIQECIPIRLKGIHIVNQPIIFNIGYAVFKPFFSEKFKKRMKFHGTNWKALHQIISPENLPPKYGGTMIYPESPGKLMVELLQHYDEDYRIVNAYGYTKEKYEKKNKNEINPILLT